MRFSFSSTTSEEKACQDRRLPICGSPKKTRDLGKNKAGILKLANDAHLGHVQFIEEKIGGTISWRKRQIATVLENTQEGDTIIVSELSRLGHSMLECMEILSLAMQKGVHVYAVKGNWQLNNSIQSKIVAMAFAMAAEYETLHDMTRFTFSRTV